MAPRDFAFSFAASAVTAIFLLPTFQATGLYANLPFPLALLFVAFPAVSVLGMYVARVLGKRLPILWQVAKFGQVGVLNTAIDFGILNLLINYTQVTSGVGIIFINVASFTIALINSYFWNKQWVFGGARKSNFLTFAVVTIIGLSINTGVVYGLTTYVSPIIVTSPNLWANLAKVLATGLSMVWNFSGYKLVVFKSRSA